MDISSIIKSDMNAILSAFTSDDFRNMNIFSNRIMTDAIFCGNDNFAIVGLFLKDMAITYESMKANEELTTFSTAKSFGASFISRVQNIDINIEEIWDSYLNFRISILEYLQNEHEKKNYEQNFEFSHLTFKMLLDFLNAEKNTLLLEKNKLLAGILNEMSRVFKVHGSTLNDFYVMTLIRALQLYSEYSDFYGVDRKKNVIDSIFPYVDSIVKILKTEPVNQKNVSDILVKMISDWRYSYIRFLERPKFIPFTEKEVPISDETKKIISETVAKALQEEVK